FGTIASQFNDPGMNTLYKAVMDKIVAATDADLQSDYTISEAMSEKVYVIPPSRTRYLSEIAENNRAYDKTANEQVEVAHKLYGIYKTLESVSGVMLSLTKHGIDDGGLRQAQTNTHKDFIKLLIGEFDRVKL